MYQIPNRVIEKYANRFVNLVKNKGKLEGLTLALSLEISPYREEAAIKALKYCIDKKLLDKSYRVNGAPSTSSLRQVFYDLPKTD